MYQLYMYKIENVVLINILGVCPEICATVKKLGFKRPTKIQSEAIPPALTGIAIII